MAHLELMPANKRVSTQTLDVKPNQPITIGVSGYVDGLRLLATLDDSTSAIAAEAPATMCKAAALPKNQKQFTFLREGYFRIDLRMGNVNWDWLRIRCANRVPTSAAELNTQGSGTLYIEVLWTREPPKGHPLEHYVINARTVLGKYGFRLVVSPGSAFTASRLIDFRTDIVCSPAGNLDVLSRVVTTRAEYLNKNALVVVLGPARQHTEAALDPGGLLGKVIGSEYGARGNPYVVLNFNKVSADGMTLLHEMGHAAGFHGHEEDEGRRTNLSHHRVMSYGPRRNALTVEQVENFKKAFFRRT